MGSDLSTSKSTLAFFQIFEVCYQPFIWYLLSRSGLAPIKIAYGSYVSHVSSAHYQGNLKTADYGAFSVVLQQGEGGWSLR